MVILDTSKQIKKLIIIFIIITLALGQCSFQIYNCRECSNTTNTTVCIKCNDNFKLYNNTCTGCPSGFYSNGNQSCLLCSAANCHRCSLDGTECINCISYYKIAGKNCTPCENGTYSNTGDIVCHICYGYNFYHCWYCSQNGSCTSCHQNFYLISYYWYSHCYKCNEGYFAAAGTSSTCFPCNATNCYTCTIANNGSTCETCIQFYGYSQGVCSLCPNGSFTPGRTKDNCLYYPPSQDNSGLYVGITTGLSLFSLIGFGIAVIIRDQYKDRRNQTQQRKIIPDVSLNTFNFSESIKSKPL